MIKESVTDAVLIEIPADCITSVITLGHVSLKGPWIIDRLEMISIDNWRG